MSSSPVPLRIARHAMATRFEFVLHGARPEALRAAAEEALDEVERIENLLSLYRPHTDIARVNARAGIGPVRVAAETFRLMQRVRALTGQTEGAFDVTAGPLVRAWGFHGGSGSEPPVAAREAALRLVGWSHLVLDPGDCSVGIDCPGGMVDLGAVGKGYALDQAAAILREAGVCAALLHGGTSTVVAIGAPPDEPGWRVALPEDAEGGAGTTLILSDESLSVSAVWGRSFSDASGQILGHVLDPRSGFPVGGAEMAAVVLPSATESDAVSTALLVLGPPGHGRIARSFPKSRMWLDGQRL